jgi:hypothetical protein
VNPVVLVWAALAIVTVSAGILAWALSPDGTHHQPRKSHLFRAGARLHLPRRAGLSPEDTHTVTWLADVRAAPTWVAARLRGQLAVLHTLIERAQVADSPVKAGSRSQPGSMGLNADEARVVPPAATGLDYQLDDNTIWRGLRAIKGGE